MLLDEITEMPLDLQSRLLRVLETKRLSRVGGSADLPVDVRVLASDQPFPERAFAEGRLREDIYYRLAVLSIALPPLRERGDDVLVLADFFLGELNLRNGTRKRLSDELRSRLEPSTGRATCASCATSSSAPTSCVMASSILERAGNADLRVSAIANADDGIHMTIGATLEEIERTFILATLEHFEGDKRRTADVLGCSLKTLYNKLHAYQRERPQLKRARPRAQRR